jgi:hypothetical protein
VSLVGGHFIHLMDPLVRDRFRSGKIDSIKFEAEMLGAVRVEAAGIDQAIGCDPLECSCSLMCHVLRHEFRKLSEEGEDGWLIKRRLSRESLAR